VPPLRLATKGQAHTVDWRSEIVSVYCGIDWAEDHHDVALVDADGALIAKRRIGDDTAGFAVLVQLLAEAGDRADEPIPVAIETSRGLLVACLRATGRRVFANLVSAAPAAGVGAAARTARASGRSRPSRFVGEGGEHAWVVLAQQ
jgi:Transposase